MKYGARYAYVENDSRVNDTEWICGVWRVSEISNDEKWWVSWLGVGGGCNGSWCMLLQWRKEIAAHLGEGRCAVKEKHKHFHSMDSYRAKRSEERLRLTRWGCEKTNQVLNNSIVNKVRHKSLVVEVREERAKVWGKLYSNANDGEKNSWKLIELRIHRMKFRAVIFSSMGKYFHHILHTMYVHVLILLSNTQLWWKWEN